MAEDALRVCRRCLLLESGETDVYEEIQRHIEKIPPKDKTPAPLYQSRIDACRQCGHLVGGTCLKCGCYPEFRAAFIKNKCPDTKKKPW
ncbi:MAG: hypothetical protein IJ766_05930 [Clostridia bacterium]|nr:hypothetical protein [Clostridia bacterium]